MKRTIWALYICALYFSTPAIAQSGYKLSNKISLNGNGKWDYLQADKKSNRLFVSHFDRVHVVDLETEKEIGTIKNLSGVHGIALAPEFNEGFISNGVNNTVTVFNYKTLDSITTIKLSTEKPDAILYDKSSKKIWVFCGKSNNAAVIDPATNQQTSTVAIGEAPEFAVSDKKGLIYNNLEEGNAIAVIDAAAQKTLRTFPLEKGSAPTGLALDKEGGRLFSACAETNKLSVVDIATGKTIATLPISSHVDAVAFDSEHKMIFCSGGDGITTIIKQLSIDKYEVLERLKTPAGAKTMALDSKTHKIYFSTADYVAGSKNIKPGSFKVLIYKI
nr:YncE family protein [Pedobacter sp. ASV19]